MTDLRARILEVAKAEIGPQTKGSLQVEAYWREVLPTTWSNQQVHLYARKAEWCGGFALWCLHQAGIAPTVYWKDGLGFLGPAGLRTTRTPARGDIGYIGSPFQHHFLFDYQDDEWIHSVDGNQPDVREQRRSRKVFYNRVTYYDISPLLPVDDSGRETNKLPPPPDSRPVLRLGATGGSVRYLQSLLPGCRVDGVFGQGTLAYLKAFQAAAGLKQDGVCGPLTWAMLEEGGK